MANSSYAYEQILFDFRDDDLTECYVALRAEGDSPLGVQGWHHKTFSAKHNIESILKSFRDEPPVLWSQKAPGIKTGV